MHQLHQAVPALLNSEALALRPIVTLRDRQAAADYPVANARDRRRRCVAAYLIEDKFAARICGVLRLHRDWRRRDRRVETELAVETSSFSPAQAAQIERLLRSQRQPPTPIPSSRVAYWASAFNVPADYSEVHQLPLIAEPSRLCFAGRDYLGRSLWLSFAAARSWAAMRAEAAAEGVVLEAISGYRSVEYQAGIWRRKLAKGQVPADILRVNVPPGFSEHHSGRALDIGTPGSAPAEPEFQATAAFRWLNRRAHQFGFTLSFPPDNPHGVMYEPWHWCHQG